MSQTPGPAQPPTPNPVGRADATVLVGWAAILEGALIGGELSQNIERKIQQRLEAADLLTAHASARELRQAVNDLNHRLRYALGEYADPPEPFPVPD
jgi:hypothetical protein